MKNESVRVISVWAVVALAVVALWFTDHLMGIHAPFKAQIAGAIEKDSILQGICGGNEEEGTAGCEEVVKSEYGFVRVPWLVVVSRDVADESGKMIKRPVTRIGTVKVPVAQLGQCYYIFMLVWFLFIGLPRLESRRWHLLPTVLSVIALCTTLYFIFVMAFKLEEWCPLCLLLHVIDFLLCVAVLLAWPRRAAAAQPAPLGASPEGPPAARAALGTRHALATLALAGVLAGMSFLHRNDQLVAAAALSRISGYKNNLTRMQKNVPLVLGAYLSSSAVHIPPRQTQVILGDPNAAHELVLFSDLQCPACRNFEHKLARKIMPLWDGQLKVSFRHYPLCTDCNKVSKNKHPQACNAAYAVEAARIVGGAPAFHKMHDLIIESYAELAQPDFAPQGFQDFAAELGLSTDAFAEAFAGQEVRNIVQADIKLAKSLGVTGTPVIYINGRRLYSYPLQTNNDIFWKALARRQVGTSLNNGRPPSARSSGQPKTPAAGN